MNGKMTILACITGFLLDCIFGDPVWMYHPIRVIGNLISVLEFDCTTTSAILFPTH